MGTARMGGLLWLLLVALAMAREADLSYLLRHPDPVLDAIMADDEGDEAFSIFLEAPSRAVHRFKGTGKPGQLTLELKTPKALYDPKKALQGLTAFGLATSSFEVVGEPVQENGNTVVDFNVKDVSGGLLLRSASTKFSNGELLKVGPYRIVAMVANGKEAIAPNLCPDGKKPEQSESGATVCYPDTAEGRALKALRSPRSKSHQAFKCTVQCNRGDGPKVQDGSGGFLQLSQQYKYHEEPTSLQTVQRSTCEVVGGLWSQAESTCLPFMVATQAKMTAPSDHVLEQVCKSEVGARFGSCLVNEALGLAHLFDIRDHTYFWLKSESVSGGVSARMGIPSCDNSTHMAFYHNWDHKHVDEYSCQSREQTLSVLCCRRR